ncbi:nucleotidyltransferase [Candidatus Berkelbacteria bacterium CG_4_9_14_3_um_filter_39_23]|uniref:Nucleotidyltransferase n=2 Tax=Candidatus Berkelbacteria TaxID=1618330 RepID=A0A2M7CI75_9BACT|nr:nucleotidyltransferase [Candidatus Berkelbacteria bacterium]OIP05489.1 MAG: hypothetical protein AUK14_01590 [Candidatus Berkelbacteria bacterium CG2_30_39_44]PIR27616.1 MAG: nucleotidyltransferase [Candidatus Berkelbacteria bacterium CG11_big_fil_rev_8_21_14_0_20_40_23]PIV25344.1 MAG: nucleotidyltransferase [Candidatus Berkelbacteria bacterium CG03_land_8_20_14_0_80_40_36]PIZ29131.1 MAG: nucleotidyltransferase [Candidatus Berkelbacteria bacterium CG_4_10_14_0_8_um_filter_39_42]PJB51862.1 M
MTKFDALKKDYSQAVGRLGEVLAMNKTKVIRDSAILRFELCFDLAWKTIKIYLEDEKGVKCFSPKVCWKEAFQNGLIEFDDLWLVMTDWRNDAVHTYNEKLADRLYGDLPKALEKFKELQKALKI